jgi:VanZ family protein
MPRPPSTPSSSQGTAPARDRLASALPAAFWFLLIMVLLSLPGESFPTLQFWKPDKIAHILLFGGQAVLLYLALMLPAPIRPRDMDPMRFSLLATILFGVLSEVYQAVFTNRAADPFDAIANAIGAALFLYLLRRIGSERILGFARRLLRIAP